MPYAYASWLYQKTGGINEVGADIFSLTPGRFEHARSG